MLLNKPRPPQNSLVRIELSSSTLNATLATLSCRQHSPRQLGLRRFRLLPISSCPQHNHKKKQPGLHKSLLPLKSTPSLRDSSREAISQLIRMSSPMLSLLSQIRLPKLLRMWTPTSHLPVMRLRHTRLLQLLKMSTKRLRCNLRPRPSTR